MNKAVFLDRDGVINEDFGYVHRIEDFKLIPRAIDGLRLLKEFTLVVITNQSGIGRGYYAEKDFLKLNEHMLKILKKEGIAIEKVFYCPHHPKEMCDCRKPSTRFVKEAQKEFNIDLSRSFVIGDHPYDIEMGRKAGCRSIYVLTGHGLKHDSKDVNADFIAKDLYEAAGWIMDGL